MPNQDAGFKLIFSNPELVRELLSSGLCDPWLDMEEVISLEKVSGSLVDERLLVRRENDLVWLCRKGEGGVDSVDTPPGKRQRALVLVEFQSSPDPIMPVRLASYLSLLYEQAHREGAFPAPGLPRALPVILYHGLPEWNSAVALTDLWSEDCPELEPVQLQLQPILIDVHHLDETKLPAENNLAGLLIRIERSEDPKVAIYWIRRMNERLLEMGETSLRKSMTQWLKHYFLPTRMPKLDFETCKTIEEIIMTSEHLTIDWSVPIREEGIRIGIEQGLKQGLEQGLEQGIRRGVKQGVEKGMEQGLEKGIEKGTFKILVKLLERRLGPLSPELEEKLEQAGLKTLNRMVDVALDIESEAQVFEELGRDEG